MSSKIVVLTGGNKGIGKAIAILLLKQTKVPMTLYLTARQSALGQVAVDELKSSGIVLPGSELVFHQLDITNAQSVDTLASHLQSTYGQIDVLVNNAGYATKGPKFDSGVVKQTLDINYYGTQRVTNALLPLIKPEGGRIVILSSMMGLLSQIPGDALRERFADPDLTQEKLDQLMKKFADDVAAGTYRKEGWPQSAYSVSKVAVTALTNMYARENPGMLINSADPGYVKTDMAPGGFKTPEQGALTPTLLSIGNIGKSTGLYFSNCEPVKWA